MIDVKLSDLKKACLLHNECDECPNKELCMTISLTPPSTWAINEELN